MGKNFKCQTFHELSRKSIFFFSPPPPTPSDGGVRGENFKVNKHQVLKSIPGMQLSCAIITLQIFWAKPGNPREGGKKGVTNGEGEVEREARAKPGNQLVDNMHNLKCYRVQQY